MILVVAFHSTSTVPIPLKSFPHPLVIIVTVYYVQASTRDPFWNAACTRVTTFLQFLPSGSFSCITPIAAGIYAPPTFSVVLWIGSVGDA